MGVYLLTIVYTYTFTHTHTHMRMCTYSELCAACGDDDESPFPQHRASHQDSGGSEHGGLGGTPAERNNDQEWITSQLQTWER